MQIIEQTTWEGRPLTVTWNDSPTLPLREQTTQASGVCFTSEGRIVLVGDGQHRFLPGGHPEEGEDLQATLAREVLEEACAIVERCEYLGAQQVQDPDRTMPFYQTRWWARVRLEPFEPRHETTERFLVHPEEFVAALNWDTAQIAQAILDAALGVEAPKKSSFPAVPPIHTQLIGVALEEVQTDSEVVGVLLQGSVARGDAYPDSDLDLLVLLRDGYHRPFRAEEREGILIEWHFCDRERAATKLHANPMLVYGFLDGKILRDDTGALEALRDVAHDILVSYRTPLDERDGILYWLQSARIKIRAALNGADLLKASFIAATTSWKVLEGVWAINDLPMPPSGAVIAHRGDLTQVPEDWDRLFDQLFMGDTLKRAEAILTVIDWLLTHS